MKGDPVSCSDTAGSAGQDGEVTGAATTGPDATNVTGVGSHGFSRVLVSERRSRMEQEMQRVEDLYRQAFWRHADASGEIDAAQLVGILRQVGWNVTQRIAKEILHRVRGA